MSAVVALSPIAAVVATVKKSSSSSSSTSSNKTSVVAKVPAPIINVDDLVIKTNERVRWTEELHDIFVKTALKLGPKAVPSRILQEMNCRQLTREQVASHLQNYRSILFPPTTTPTSSSSPVPKKTGSSKKNGSVSSSASSSSSVKRKASEAQVVQVKKARASPSPVSIVAQAQNGTVKIASQSNPAPAPDTTDSPPISPSFFLVPVSPPPLHSPSSTFSSSSMDFVDSFLSQELFFEDDFSSSSTSSSFSLEGSCDSGTLEGRLALLQSIEGRLVLPPTTSQASRQLPSEQGIMGTSINSESATEYGFEFASSPSPSLSSSFSSPSSPSSEGSITAPSSPIQSEEENEMEFLFEEPPASIIAPPSGFSFEDFFGNGNQPRFSGDLAFLEEGSDCWCCPETLSGGGRLVEF